MWHQYEISALISRVSFHGERSNRVTKFQMFSLSRLSIASHADILLVLHHGPNCTPQIWKCAVIAHIFNRSFQQTFIEGMCDKPPPKKRFSNAVHLTGLLIFRGKKSKISRDFQGQIRGKIGRFRGIFAGKKSKFAEQSADFAGFSREKSQNSQKNRPISRDFSGKKSNFEGFSGANS